jgi:hypothetical protein
MNNLALPLLLALGTLLAGCEKAAPPRTSPIKDGLFFEYRTGDATFTSPLTLRFKQTASDQYEVIYVHIAASTLTVDGLFRRDAKTRRILGFESMSVQGGEIWIPPEELKANTNKNWTVLGEETKGGYATYKVEEKEIHTHSWHEKRTGLLVAAEIQQGEESVFTTLVRTNADGMQP